MVVTVDQVTDRRLRHLLDFVDVLLPACLPRLSPP
jgi:hypothetical protein